MRYCRTTTRFARLFHSRLFASPKSTVKFTDSVRSSAGVLVNSKKKVAVGQVKPRDSFGLALKEVRACPEEDQVSIHIGFGRIDIEGGQIDVHQGRGLSQGQPDEVLARRFELVREIVCYTLQCSRGKGGSAKHASLGTIIRFPANESQMQT